MEREDGIYMDYQAGAPVDKRTIEAMLPFMYEDHGNPASMHHWNIGARKVLEDSRRALATLIGTERAENILFTSSATESNNLALKGAARRLKKKGTHIITSNVEHWSIHTPLKALQKEGFEVTEVPVDENGLVSVADISDAIREDTILVSVMAVNNEIGTVQPIAKIAALAHENGAVFHTDATAAVGRIPLNVDEMGIDMMTISSNMIYGPRGMGALYLKRGLRLEPVLQGGGQEFGMRSGTENIPGIAGIGKAAELLIAEMDNEVARLSSLQKRLLDGILENIPGASLNGTRDPRSPDNINVRFSYVEGEALVLGLDAFGIAASSGSACSSKTLEPSHVLLAIGLPHEIAHGSLQLTLGRWTTKEHVDKALEVLPQVVERLQKMSPLTPPEWLKEHYG